MWHVSVSWYSQSLKDICKPSRLQAISVKAQAIVPEFHWRWTLVDWIKSRQILPSRQLFIAKLEFFTSLCLAMRVLPSNADDATSTMKLFPHLRDIVFQAYWALLALELKTTFQQHLLANGTIIHDNIVTYADIARAHLSSMNFMLQRESLPSRSVYNFLQYKYLSSKKLACQVWLIAKLTVSPWWCKKLSALYENVEYHQQSDLPASMAPTLLWACSQCLPVCRLLPSPWILQSTPSLIQKTFMPAEWMHAFLSTSDDPALPVKSPSKPRGPSSLNITVMSVTLRHPILIQSKSHRSILIAFLTFEVPLWTWTSWWDHLEFWHPI